MFEFDLNKFRFYPIVPSFRWVETCVQAGVSSVQLRIKKSPAGALAPASSSDFFEILPAPELCSEIEKAISYCRDKGCQLFINDHWRIAVELGAFGVHLGYEDSFDVDFDLLKRKNIYFGISTHSEKELLYALNLQPNYIAFGPVFPTVTKHVPFEPQGVQKIRDWREKIPAHLPLVAIGGIRLENATELFSFGADCLSVISDITVSNNPQSRLQSWVKITNS